MRRVHSQVRAPTPTTPSFRCNLIRNTGGGRPRFQEPRSPGIHGAGGNIVPVRFLGYGPRRLVANLRKPPFSGSKQGNTGAPIAGNCGRFPHVLLGMQSATPARPLATPMVGIVVVVMFVSSRPGMWIRKATCGLEAEGKGSRAWNWAECGKGVGCAWERSGMCLGDRIGESFGKGRGGELGAPAVP